MQKNIIVVAEILDNNLRPVTYELIAFAEELAEFNSAKLQVIVINNKAQKYAKEIREKTGSDIIAVNTAELQEYNSAAYKNILEKILKNYNPLFICIANTSQGLDFAPGLAVRLDCACITGVNGFSKNNFSRSIYGGKIDILVKPETGTAIITILPGIFKSKKKENKPGLIKEINISEKPLKIKNHEIIKAESEPSKLSEAKIIVSIGRGIKDPENIKIAEEFATCVTDASIACSRPLVDMGWMKYKHQVGITGAMISPDIYIACGISGSSQHIAAIKGADFVISINNDPNAAIFNVSDICIVENLLNFFNSFKKFHIK